MTSLLLLIILLPFFQHHFNCVGILPVWFCNLFCVVCGASPMWIHELIMDPFSLCDFDSVDSLLCGPVNSSWIFHHVKPPPIGHELSTNHNIGHRQPHTPYPSSSPNNDPPALPHGINSNVSHTGLNHIDSFLTGCPLMVVPKALALTLSS